MGRLYDRLLTFFNISGRDLAVFLLALLLAFSIWLIHNLSLKYNAYLDVKVQAICNIEGHSLVSADNVSVVARCRATGYKVIRNSFKSSRNYVVQVDFQPSVMKHMSDDLFYVASSDLKEYTHLIYGDGVTLDYFVTDTLFFHFPMENSRKVPVLPVYSVSYQQQYINIGALSVTPDSVVVHGEPSIIENIHAVSTFPIKKSNVSTDIQGEISLDPVKGARISEEKVHYSLKVARFVEFKERLPLNVLNAPMDKSVIVMPSTVEVTLRCIFPMQGNPLDGLEAVIDYDDYLMSLSGKCSVELSGVTRGIIAYDISPAAVDCIVEDRQP